ncbi:uncharacterized protein METZ01_LOCUS354907, partial [marine metagenome]
TMKSIEVLVLKKLKNVLDMKLLTTILVNGLKTKKILNGLLTNIDGVKKRRKMLQKWKKARTPYHF